MKLITTPEGIFTLTRTILKARGTADAGGQTYFHALIAATQQELGTEPRERNATGRAPRLTEEGVATQLTALSAVHTRFYQSVLRACSEDLPGGTARALELNRRSNFARTAMGTVRRWIKAGGNITTVAAQRASKRTLQVLSRPRAATPKLLARRVERGITELIEDTGQLAQADRAAAVTQLQTAISALAEKLNSIEGHTATRDPVQALAQHRVLKTKAGMFYPMGNHPVIMQQGAPS